MIKRAILSVSDKTGITQLARRLADRGVTLLSGKGGFTGQEKMVLLTVVHNYQIKRLEEAVFSVDQNAFLIIENTFTVIGSGFSKRKIY